ncbi:unnamed protein product [Auanema sp. JU1783]|nr:unnamed protein product [Auanema sp. JU1783]
MALIIENIFLIFIFSSIFGIFRSIFSIIDWQTVTEKTLMIIPTDISCPANSSFPHFLSFLLCFFTFLLILERVYATHNYRSYEYTSWMKIIKQLFLLSWTPLPFIIILNISSFLQAKNNFHICEVIELNRTVYQRNTWIFLVFFFNAIFSIIFLHLYHKNVEHERNYVRFHYSTLSIRFQMKENLSTSLFMTKANFLISFFFLLAILIDYKFIQKQFPFMDTFIYRETWYLAITALHLVFPTFLLFNHSKIYLKFKKWWFTRLNI